MWSAPTSVGQPGEQASSASPGGEILAFQRLVGDIAARFAAIEADGIDGAISDCLREIGESLQLDRAVLWRTSPGDGAAIATHFWSAEPIGTAPPDLSLDAIPWVLSRLAAGQAAWFSKLDDIPDANDRQTFSSRRLLSGAAVPLTLEADGTQVLGALAFSSALKEHEWVPSLIERLTLVAAVISQALARKTAAVALRRALDEVQRLRDRAETGEDDAEPHPAVRELRRETRLVRTPAFIVAESPSVKHALAQVAQVAGTSATVLLLGETGAGKEVFAQAIHDLSPRHQRPMMRVSCAAIPAALIESELFGRERGAYTGALSRQIGRFEAANQSTIFLDEIGDLPPEVQVKLLRVLQERTFERLGSTQPIKIDVRIIAATNRDLEKAVFEKTFREDLYYRLNVFPIAIPPLRERIDDIPGLVWAFVDEFSRAFGKPIESVSKDSIRELQRYAWPGNVRELRNVVERAVVLATGRQLVLPTPKPSSLVVPQAALTLEALEVEHIRKVLEKTNWRIRGGGGAAERLGLKPTTLESRMARLGIRRNKST